MEMVWWAHTLASELSISCPPPPFQLVSGMRELRTSCWHGKSLYLAVGKGLLAHLTL